jgi:hypothetical protein
MAISSGWRGHPLAVDMSLRGFAQGGLRLWKGSVGETGGDLDLDDRNGFDDVSVCASCCFSFCRNR